MRNSIVVGIAAFGRTNRHKRLTKTTFTAGIVRRKIKDHQDSMKDDQCLPRDETGNNPRPPRTVKSGFTAQLFKMGLVMCQLVKREARWTVFPAVKAHAPSLHPSNLL